MQPLRFAQISDLHFTEISWNPLRLFSKRILGNLNWVFARKNNFSTEQLEAIPSFLRSLNLDRVLLAGDFTTTALFEEFETAKKFIDKLPVPWTAVPGNHDRYTYRACREKHFYRYFTNPKKIEHKTDFFNLAEHGVEAHRLSPTWWLIALDTSRATNLYSSTGLFSMKQEALLRELLTLIPSDHQILLLNHYPFFDNAKPRHALVRGLALEQLLKEEPRIKAYLHGHTHRHTIANLQPSNLPVILDGGCSASEKNGSWNVLTINDSGLNVEVYRWNKGWTLSQKKDIAWTR